MNVLPALGRTAAWLACAYALNATAADLAPLPPPPAVTPATASIEEETRAAEASVTDAKSSRLAEPPELEQPDLPEPVRNGETMQPDITIIHRGKDTLEEYRVNGKRYMVKITPAVGPAYYLIDTDGDGNLDVRRSNIESGVQLPQWVLFSW